MTWMQVSGLTDSLTPTEVHEWNSSESSPGFMFHDTGFDIYRERNTFEQLIVTVFLYFCFLLTT